MEQFTPNVSLSSYPIVRTSDMPHAYVGSTLARTTIMSRTLLVIQNMVSGSRCLQTATRSDMLVNYLQLSGPDFPHNNEWSTTAVMSDLMISVR